MTSRALRYSPTLSQSCSGHKVNIRHQRAARVTAFPVSILPHPSLPYLSARPFGARNALALVRSSQSVERFHRCQKIFEYISLDDGLRDVFLLYHMIIDEVDRYRYILVDNYAFNRSEEI